MDISCGYGKEQRKNMVDIKTVIETANRLNIPCIIDASAEEDLSKYGIFCKPYFSSKLKKKYSDRGNVGGAK